jgi:hypothetical protein
MRNRGRGQAVVEFGLVAILFFTLLFGVVDLGMVLNDWISASSAASVGGRHAAVGACMEGPAADPFTCSAGETSVIGAVMQSAPLLATGGNCQNRPQPAVPGDACLSRVDIGVVDLSVANAPYCQDAELWAYRQTALAGSTSTVIKMIRSVPAVQNGALVGRQLTFTSGQNATAASTITANSDTALTVAPGFSRTPAVGDAFNATTLTLAPIASGWLLGCSGSAPNPAINTALNVVVRAQVELPVPLPGMPTDMYVESSSTVRFEGTYLP